MTTEYRCTDCRDPRLVWYTWAGYKKHTRIAHNTCFRRIQAVQPDVTPKDILMVRNLHLQTKEVQPQPKAKKTKRGRKSPIVLPTERDVAQILQ